MKQVIFAAAFASAVFSLAGCATQGAEHHHAAAPPRAAVGATTRAVELPGSAGAGEPREVSVLVDQPTLKLATIVLRGGTVLPAHQTEVPVTIVVLQGSGTLIVGAERTRLDATHAAVLAPNVSHAVEPDAGTDLILLVHHLGSSKHHHE